MLRKHITCTVVGFACIAAQPAYSAAWSDTSLGYRYGTRFTEPGNPNNIQRNILQFTYISGYSAGQNFLNIDILRSDHNDPSKDSTHGATEVYLTYRYQHYLSRAFDRAMAIGPVKDIAFTFGLDANTKDTAFAPRKHLLVAGPTLKFNVPGFLDISLLYAQEWNHCGLPACELPGNDDTLAFDPYWLLSTAWKFNLTAASVPLKFQGFINYGTEKGDDYFHNTTAAETLARTSLMADVGQLAWQDKNTLWVGIGYEYWHNKFGNHDKPGVTTRTPTLQLEWYF